MTIDYNDVLNYLQTQPKNTVDTPYRLNITNIPTSAFNGQVIFSHSSNLSEWLQDFYFEVSDLGKLLIQGGRYVDLSETVLPSGITNMQACFATTPLTASPVLSDATQDMTMCFYKTFIKDLPTIPNACTILDYAFAKTLIKQSFSLNDNITSAIGCFFNNDITTPNDINSDADVSLCYAKTKIGTTPTIPSDYQKDLSFAFYGDDSLTQGTNIPSGVTNMTSCFEGCSALSLIKDWELDVTKVDMTDCFKGASNLSRIEMPTSTVKEKADDYYFYLLYFYNVDGQRRCKYLVYQKDGVLLQSGDTVVYNNTMRLFFNSDELILADFQIDNNLNVTGDLDNHKLDDLFNHHLTFGDNFTPDIHHKWLVVNAIDPEHVISNAFVKRSEYDALLERLKALETKTATL